MVQDALARPGSWILVTGATRGLGREIALQLARAGHTNLVVVGRGADALDALAADIRACGVDALPVLADLGTQQGLEHLADALRPLALTAAVLNAGVTQIGAFERHDAAAYQAMIDLNVSYVTALTCALLPALKPQCGRLMLVASLGGIAALPYQAVYAGTKAFLVNFGLSLAAEAETAPARVIVFAPGGIATDMTAGPEFAGQAAHLMPVEAVASSAVKALYGSNALVIPGWQNKAFAAALKILPRRWTTALTQRSFRKSISAAQTKA